VWEIASMTIKHLVAAGALLAGLAGCGSGDINIDPATNVSNSNNTTNEGGGNGGGTTNPCASYVNTAGQTIQGSYDGTNCTYAPAFVDAGNNLTVDMTIPALPNNGAHIFQGSLFVGETYTTDAAMAAAGIAEGGDGPVLTIEAGARVAFSSNAQFMVINRGSQIFAVGRPDAPITITSLSDVNGTVGPFDVQQWGGLVINGFGVTNQCAYTGVLGSDTTPLQLAGECHVESEGSAGLDENHYGGVNNDDSSGRLEYVIIKHTGATVGNGDELNGITFGAVGRNTIVRNVEVYSVYDDGLEFFGGAVNVENYLALYVRDDSLDMDEGYSGTITNALIVQSETDGNSCIEADGIGDFSNLPAAQVEAVIAQGINSRPTINHMTCIFSANGPGTATHEPGVGMRLREGIFPTINDSLVIGSFSANDQTAANDNYCLRIDDRSQQAALDGAVQLNSVIYSCAERTRGQTFPGGAVTEESFAVAEGNVFATVANNTAVNPTAAADAGLQLLEGSPPVFSIAWASSLVDGVAPGATTTPTTATRPFLGALSTGETNWTQPWAYGLDPANRGVELWFE
jgi:hypothetical protein